MNKSARNRPGCRKRAAVANSEGALVPAEKRPVRGLKLRTVSVLTMLIAVLCLLAFIAVRPPASAARPATEAPFFLGVKTAVHPVPDLEKAPAWYSSALGTEPRFDETLYVGFPVGGNELDLVPVSTSAEEPTPSGVACWDVEEAQAANKRLLDRGAALQGSVAEVGDRILIVAVHDPVGDVLGTIPIPPCKPGGAN